MSTATETPAEKRRRLSSEAISKRLSPSASSSQIPPAQEFASASNLAAAPSLSDASNIPVASQPPKTYVERLKESTQTRLIKTYKMEFRQAQVFIETTFPNNDIVLSESILAISPEVFPGEFLIQHPHPDIPSSERIDRRAIDLDRQRLPTNSKPAALPRYKELESDLFVLEKKSGSSLFAERVPVTYQDADMNISTSMMQLASALAIEQRKWDAFQDAQFGARISLAFWLYLTDMMKTQFEKDTVEGGVMIPYLLLRLTFACPTGPKYLYVHANHLPAPADTLASSKCHDIQLPLWMKKLYGNKCDIECVVAPPLAGHDQNSSNLILEHASLVDQEWSKTLTDSQTSQITADLSRVMNNMKFLVEGQLVMVYVPGPMGRTLYFWVRGLGSLTPKNKWRHSHVVDISNSRKKRGSANHIELKPLLQDASPDSQKGSDVASQYFHQDFEHVHSNYIQPIDPRVKTVKKEDGDVVMIDSFQSAPPASSLNRVAKTIDIFQSAPAASSAAAASTLNRVAKPIDSFKSAPPASSLNRVAKQIDSFQSAPAASSAAVASTLNRVAKQIAPAASSLNRVSKPIDSFQSAPAASSLNRVAKPIAAAASSLGRVINVTMATALQLNPVTEQTASMQPIPLPTMATITTTGPHIRTVQQKSPVKPSPKKRKTPHKPDVCAATETLIQNATNKSLEQKIFLDNAFKTWTEAYTGYNTRQNNEQKVFNEGWDANSTTILQNLYDAQDAYESSQNELASAISCRQEAKAAPAASSSSIKAVSAAPAAAASSVSIKAVSAAPAAAASSSSIQAPTRRRRRISEDHSMDTDMDTEEQQLEKQLQMNENMITINKMIKNGRIVLSPIQLEEVANSLDRQRMLVDGNASVLTASF